ncbi:hypothetical protein N7497_003692 [Penicillium chrysogenum]|nr:hypothetical protein N7497_003692 [Penicillium chrysogenum]
MKTLTSLFILAASAIITPVAGTSSPGHFRLKSFGATNQEHNNLYVYAYHTVCNWYHNAPQLFYLNRNYNATIPSSCSKIQLKAEYIN